MSNYDSYQKSLDHVRADHEESRIPELDMKQACPRRLFHYTNTDAFTKIVQEGLFWATDYRYLNDASELQHGGQIFRGEIADLVGTDRFGGIDILGERLLRVFGDIDWRQRLFLVCFCSEGNLLSQWRAYGDCAGKGSVSLGLESKR